jgi:hypothetical protein
MGAVVSCCEGGWGELWEDGAVEGERVGFWGEAGEKGVEA